MDELTWEVWGIYQILDIAERHNCKAEFNFGTKTLFLDGNEQNTLDAFCEIEYRFSK